MLKLFHLIFCAELKWFLSFNTFLLIFTFLVFTIFFDLIKIFCVIFIIIILTLNRMMHGALNLRVHTRVQ